MITKMFKLRFVFVFFFLPSYPIFTTPTCFSSYPTRILHSPARIRT